MTLENPSNAADLEYLETQVRKARRLVRESELKVEAIEASIHEIEQFHPKIKIIRPPPTGGSVHDAVSLIAETALLKPA